MHSSRMPALYRIGGGQRPPGQNLPPTENHHPWTETLTPGQIPLYRDLWIETPWKETP